MITKLIIFISLLNVAGACWTHNVYGFMGWISTTLLGVALMRSEKRER